ncbi:MAG: hypothetical protein WAU36_01115 [Cyclobacteriaceae bacterium]
MKTHHSIIIISLLIQILISCKDTAEDTPTIGLVGSWIEVSRTTSDCATPSHNGSTVCTNSNTCQTYKFTATSITWSSPNDTPINGTYSATNSKIEISWNNGGTGSDINYKVDNITLTLTYQDSGGSTVCTATETYKRL